MIQPDDPPTPNELYIKELEFDRADLLEELKRLIERMETIFTHSVYENEVYEETEISRALITKIEGKEDE